MKINYTKLKFQFTSCAISYFCLRSVIGCYTYFIPTNINGEFNSTMNSYKTRYEKLKGMKCIKLTS